MFGPLKKLPRLLQWDGRTRSSRQAEPLGWCAARGGEPIQERQVDLLKEEHRAWLDNQTTKDHGYRGASLFMILSLLTAVVVLYVARFQASLAASLPMIAGVCVLVL